MGSGRTRPLFVERKGSNVPLPFGSLLQELMTDSLTRTLEIWNPPLQVSASVETRLSPVPERTNPFV